MKIWPLFSAQKKSWKSQDFSGCWIKLKIGRKDLSMCLDANLETDNQIETTKFLPIFLSPTRKIWALFSAQKKSWKSQDFSGCWIELKIGRKDLSMCLDAILETDSQIATTKFRPISFSPARKFDQFPAQKKVENPKIVQVVRLSWKLVGKTSQCV